jgi:hypothetical protein
MSWFDRLIWNDCIYEETHLYYRDGLKSRNDDNISLSSKERKGNFRKISIGYSTAQYGKK